MLPVHAQAATVRWTTRPTYQIHLFGYPSITQYIHDAQHSWASELELRVIVGLMVGNNNVPGVAKSMVDVSGSASSLGKAKRYQACNSFTLL